MAKKKKKSSRKKSSPKLYGAALAAHERKLARGRKSPKKSQKSGMGRIESDYWTAVKAMRDAGMHPRGDEREVRVVGGRVVYGYKKRPPLPSFIGKGRGAKGKSERAVDARYARQMSANIHAHNTAERVRQLKWGNMVRQFGESKARDLWHQAEERARLRTVTQHSR